MIGKLTGTIDTVCEEYIILNVNDVGYRVFCSTKVLNLIQNCREKVSLWIETVVKEDSITLFGFNKQEEQECFNTLCKVSGIGAKVALKIMSVLNYDEIIFAIINDDSKMFCKAPGVGSKVAVRIIHELQNCRMVKNFGNIAGVSGIKITEENIVDDNSDGRKIIADAIMALEGLGYQKSMIHTIVVKIVTEKPHLTLESVITESLKKINNFN